MPNLEHPETPFWKRWVGDIRFWILLLFLLRLYGITLPPMEVAHNWRQATVCMVARNFQEVDNNILYPRIDIAGEKSGITGMEFPLLNYLIYGVSEVFGYQHWYGRLINLIVSSFGLYYFFLVIRRLFNQQTAFFSTISLALSLWLIFSRKIMPDTFSVSLAFASVWYGLQYFKSSRWTHLFGFVVFLVLSVLVKLPAIITFVLLAPVLLQKPFSRQHGLVIGLGALGLVPAVWWYFFWVPHLVETFGFWHFYMGTDILSGAKDLLAHWDQTLERFVISAVKISGFILFLGGVVLSAIRKEKTLLWIGALAIALQIPFMCKAGFAFYHHNYYIIPFVTFMVIFIGYLLNGIKVKWLQWGLLALLCLEGVTSQFHDWKIREDYQFKGRLEAFLATDVPADALIVINSTGNPSDMYFAHRRGWALHDKDLHDVGVRSDLHKKGATFLLEVKKFKTGDFTQEGYTIVKEDAELGLYSIP